MGESPSLKEFSEELSAVLKRLAHATAGDKNDDISDVEGSTIEYDITFSCQSSGPVTAVTPFSNEAGNGSGGVRLGLAAALMQLQALLTASLDGTHATVAHESVFLRCCLPQALRTLLGRSHEKQGYGAPERVLEILRLALLVIARALAAARLPAAEEEAVAEALAVIFGKDRPFYRSGRGSGGAGGGDACGDGVDDDVLNTDAWRRSVGFADWVDAMSVDLSTKTRRWRRAQIVEEGADGRLRLSFEGLAEYHNVWVTRDSPEISPENTQTQREERWRHELTAGSLVDCAGPGGQWCNATILDAKPPTLVRAPLLVPGETPVSDLLVACRIYAPEGDHHDGRGGGCYFGHGPAHDEWLLATSHKLQQLNSRAAPRNSWTPEQPVYDGDDPVDPAIFAVCRPPRPNQIPLSAALVENVNVFGNEGGFEALLVRVEQSGGRSGGSGRNGCDGGGRSAGGGGGASRGLSPSEGEKSSGTAGGNSSGGSSSGVVDSESSLSSAAGEPAVAAPMTMVALRWLLLAVGNVRSCLRRGFVEPYVDALATAAAKALRSRNDVELRALTKERLDSVLSALQMCLGRTRTRSEVARYLELLQLDLALGFYRSAFIQRRLHGLKVITDMAGSAGRSGSVWMTCASFVEWVERNDLVAEIFSGQAELISRSAELIGLLVRERALTAAHVHAIWAATRGPAVASAVGGGGGGGGDVERKIAAYKVIQAHYSSLPVDLQAQIVSGLEELAPEEVIEDTVLLMRRLADATGTAVGLVPRLVDMLWRMVEAEPGGGGRTREERVLLPTSTSMSVTPAQAAGNDVSGDDGCRGSEVEGYSAAAAMAPTGSLCGGGSGGSGTSVGGTGDSSGIYGSRVLERAVEVLIDIYGGYNMRQTRHAGLRRCAANLTARRANLASLRVAEVLLDHLPLRAAAAVPLAHTVVSSTPTRAEVIDGLDNEYGLLQGLVDELCEHVAAARPRCRRSAAALGPDAGVTVGTLEQQIWARLKFLHYVLAHSSLVLTAGHVAALWDALLAPLKSLMSLQPREQSMESLSHASAGLADVWREPVPPLSPLPEVEVPSPRSLLPPSLGDVPDAASAATEAATAPHPEGDILLDWLCDAVVLHDASGIAMFGEGVATCIFRDLLVPWVSGEPAHGKAVSNSTAATNSRSSSIPVFLAVAAVSAAATNDLDGAVAGAATAAAEGTVPAARVPATAVSEGAVPAAQVPAGAGDSEFDIYAPITGGNDVDVAAYPAVAAPRAAAATAAVLPVGMVVTAAAGPATSVKAFLCFEAFFLHVNGQAGSLCPRESSADGGCSRGSSSVGWTGTATPSATALASASVGFADVVTSGAFGPTAVSTEDDDQPRRRIGDRVGVLSNTAAAAAAAAGGGKGGVSEAGCGAIELAASGLELLVLPSALVGIDALWDLALEAQNASVADAAIRLLNRTHHHLSPTLQGGAVKVRQDYIAACMAHIEPATSGGASGGSEDAEAHERTVLRSVQLLENVLDETELQGAGGQPSHGARLRGQKLVLTVDLRQLAHVQTATEVPETSRLEGYSNRLTLWDVRCHVAHLTGLQADDVRLQRSIGGVTIGGDGDVCGSASGRSSCGDLGRASNPKTLAQLGIQRRETWRASRASYPFGRRAALLTVGGELTVRMRSIVTDWFRSHSSDGFMTRQGAAHFIHSCCADNCVPGDRRVSRFMEFAEPGASRLSLDDFLRLYRKSSRDVPDTVWSNLRAHGYKNDLTRDADTAAAAAAAAARASAADAEGSDVGIVLPCDILSATPAYWELFMKVLDMGGIVAERMQSLLMRLPTNPDLLHAIETLAPVDPEAAPSDMAPIDGEGLRWSPARGEGAALTGWNMLLDSHSPYRMLYALQIVHSLLEAPEPAPVPLSTPLQGLTQASALSLARQPPPLPKRSEEATTSWPAESARRREAVRAASFDAETHAWVPSRNVAEEEASAVKVPELEEAATLVPSGWELSLRDGPAGSLKERDMAASADGEADDARVPLDAVVPDVAVDRMPVAEAPAAQRPPASSPISGGGLSGVASVVAEGSAEIDTAALAAAEAAKSAAAAVVAADEARRKAATAAAQSEMRRRDAWRRRFVRLGGFNHLCATVMAQGGDGVFGMTDPASMTPEQHRCLALLLKVLRVLLFEALSSADARVAALMGLIRRRSSRLDSFCNGVHLPEPHEASALTATEAAVNLEVELRATVAAPGSGPGLTQVGLLEDGDINGAPLHPWPSQPGIGLRRRNTGEQITHEVNFERLQARLLELVRAAADISDRQRRSARSAITHPDADVVMAVGSTAEAANAVAEEALGLWVGCAMSQGSMLQALFRKGPCDSSSGAAAEHVDFDNMVLTVLFCHSRTVRREFAHALRQLCTHVPATGYAAADGDDRIEEITPNYYFLTLLLRSIPGPKEDATRGECDEFFELLCSLVRDACSSSYGGIPAIDVETLLETLVSRIEAHPVKELHHCGITGSRSPASPDKLLMGLMKLTSVAVSAAPVLKPEVGAMLIPAIFGDCLFPPQRVASTMEEANAPAPPKCKTEASRCTAYRLLSALCRGCLQNTALMLDACLAPLLPPSVPAPDKWGYSPSAGAKSSSGRVGLRNLSNTCYMNSCLQQLFMIPEVRAGLLDVFSDGGDEEDGQSGAAAADGSNQNGGSSSSGESKPVSTLALVKSGAADITSDAIVTAGSGSGCENGEQNGGSLLEQMQLLFAHLMLSDKQAADPQALVRSMRGPNDSAIDVSVQQDAQDFLLGLIDQLEAGLRGTRQAHLFKDCFQGQFVNQIILEDGSSRAGEMREREEPFLCISLEVKNVRGMTDALPKYVAKDAILDYKWDEERPCVTISKRTVLGTLPETLIVHLNRFTLNLDTFMTEKLNTRFEFPARLDLEPFTKEGLAWREAAAAAADAAPTTAGAVAGEAGEADGFGGAGARESSTAARGTETLGDKAPTLEPYALHPQSHYAYELRGVVVHYGSANQGHYFSYIRDIEHDAAMAAAAAAATTAVPISSAHRGGKPSAMSGTTSASNGGGVGGAESSAAAAGGSSDSGWEDMGTWYEFNDMVVKDWDPRQMEADCFGGSIAQDTDELGWPRFGRKDNIQNAYLLLYSRVKQPPTAWPSSESIVPSAAAVAADVSGPAAEQEEHIASTHRVVVTQIPRSIFKEIYDGNNSFALERWLYHTDFTRFILNVLRAARRSLMGQRPWDVVPSAAASSDVAAASTEVPATLIAASAPAARGDVAAATADGRVGDGDGDGMATLTSAAADIACAKAGVTEIKLPADVSFDSHANDHSSVSKDNNSPSLKDEEEGDGQDRDEGDSVGRALAGRLLEWGTAYSLRHLSRLQENHCYSDMLRELECLYSRHSTPARACIEAELASGMAGVRELLLECSDRSVRERTAAFYLRLLCLVAVDEEGCLLDMEPVEGIVGMEAMERIEPVEVEALEPEVTQREFLVSGSGDLGAEIELSAPEVSTFAPGRGSSGGFEDDDRASVVTEDTSVAAVEDFASDGADDGMASGSETATSTSAAAAFRVVSGAVEIGIEDDGLLLAFGPRAGERPVALLSRFVDGLLGMLSDAAQHWAKFEYFFRVLDGIAAMGDGQRDLLLRRGAVSILLDFYLGEKSPLCGSGGRPARMGHRVAPPRFGPLLECVVRCVRHCGETAAGANVNEVSTGEPQLSARDRRCLDCDDLYEIAYENAYAPEEVAELMCQWAAGHGTLTREFSRMLVRGIDNSPQGDLQPWLVALRAWLAVEDGLERIRAAEVFGRDPWEGNDTSLLAILYDQRQKYDRWCFVCLQAVADVLREQQAVSLHVASLVMPADADKAMQSSGGIPMRYYSDWILEHVVASYATPPVPTWVDVREATSLVESLREWERRAFGQDSDERRAAAKVSAEAASRRRAVAATGNMVSPYLAEDTSNHVTMTLGEVMVPLRASTGTAYEGGAAIAEDEVDELDAPPRGRLAASTAGAPPVAGAGGAWDDTPLWPMLRCVVANNRPDGIRFTFNFKLSGGYGLGERPNFTPPKDVDIWIAGYDIVVAFEVQKRDPGADWGLPKYFWRFDTEKVPVGPTHRVAAGATAPVFGPQPLPRSGDRGAAVQYWGS